MTQVSMIVVRALAAAVEAQGVGREQFLVSSGLSACQLDDVYSRISHADYDRARRSALTLSGDPALGLNMGGRASVGSFDFLGLLAEHSGSLRAALQVAVRYARTVVEGAHLELVEFGDTALVRSMALRGEVPEVRMSAEFTASSLVYLVQRFVGGAALPRRVYFAYEPPAHREVYSRMFAGREQFGHAFTGIELERAWLDCSHAYGSSELHAMLLGRAERFHSRASHRMSTADRVKNWLASQSPESRPSMDAVARALGMSGRSLRRRLHEECTTYEDLVRNARIVQAKNMLSDSPQSIQEIAYALGFETPAAFSRAFRRWTGMAPSAYRAGT